MNRWKNTSKNVALNTTIQMTGVLRRHCVNAYNTAVHELGIDTLRRVVDTLRVPPRVRSGSPEHLFLSNYAFFAANGVMGKRRVFVRQFKYLVRQDMRALRERIMASPFGAWECVGNASETRDGFLWRAIGLPDRGEHQDDAPTYSPTRVRVVTDIEATPVGTRLGEVRAGWLVNLEDLGIGNSARIQQDLAGCSALLFSIAMPPHVGDRLKKVAARRGWHGELSAHRFEFMRADYERDILTQITTPDHRQCGLDRFYFLPLRLRNKFPERFFTELTRRIANGSGAGSPIWHIQIARAITPAQQEALFIWFDELRVSVEKRVNYYSVDSVELPGLRRIASDEDLLGWMGISPDFKINLDSFPNLPSQPVELLDLSEEWLEKAQINPHIPISRARISLKEQPPRLQEEFEASVNRHLSRMRWVSLMKALRDPDEEDAPAEQSAPELKGYTLSLPGYSELRRVADELFDPALGQRPIRDFLAPLKGRLSKLESAIHHWRASDDLEAVETLTLADLPMSKGRLAAASGIGPTTVSTIEELLFDELLAWPRALDARPANAQQAGEQLADGLDELDDLFG